MNVLMPQLGETVTEGKVATWFKKVGDAVAAGENLFEIETEKVTMEVQAISSGVLAEIRVPAGETVPVGTIIAVLGGAGEKPKPKSNGAAAAKAAPALALDPFREVRTPERNFGRATGAGGVRISPLARRLAAERGIDLAAIAESVASRGGRRIGASDVREARASSAPRGGALTLNRIRAMTARRMAEAWRTIPHVFQAVEVDFSAVERARQQQKARFEARAGVGLTYLPFLARAACLAISEFPQVNAAFEQDRLVLRRDINLGIAVDLAHEGLVVPVVAHADEMTAGGLAKAIARQVEKARAQKLLPADVEGGTYTISNNGRFGTLFTAPIINMPQVAILSFDAVKKRAVVVESEHGDAIAARPVAVVGQSFDHRAFDGAYSAAFLKRLKEILETRDWASELA
ncbi:MAG TPA: dihydrolipoamide acetyltransferase family protein [Stellaceae bacterium]|nr:dihydrolipoamide acetyltransferase family protein [Stellaceae bacterium]